MIATKIVSVSSFLLQCQWHMGISMCASDSLQKLCQMIRIIVNVAVLGDGWVLADTCTLQRTRTNSTGTYTERMTTIGMPMGVFDALAMKELVQLKREFKSFMDWDASFAYTPSNLQDHKTLFRPK